MTSIISSPLTNTCNLMCWSCNGNLASNDPASQYQRLKIIQNTVRVPSSLYTMNLGALNVYQFPTNPTGVNWNQMSDRSQRHFQPVNVSSHGSSTRRTITRNRPGASTPGGFGVDIKHNSYYRYLDRLKGKKPIRRGEIPPNFGTPIPFNPAFPIYGGKTMKTSIINNCNCPREPIDLNENLIYATYYSPAELFKPGCSVCNYNVGSYIYGKKSINGEIIRAIITAINGDFYTIQYDNGRIDTTSGLDVSSNFSCSCPGNAVIQVIDANSSNNPYCNLPTSSFTTAEVDNYYLQCYPSGTCANRLI